MDHMQMVYQKAKTSNKRMLRVTSFPYLGMPAVKKASIMVSPVVDCNKHHYLEASYRVDLAEDPTFICKFFNTFLEFLEWKQ